MRPLRKRTVALLVVASLLSLFSLWLLQSNVDVVDHNYSPDEQCPHYKQNGMMPPSAEFEHDFSNGIVQHEWDECRLPTIDPWNPAVLPFFKCPEKTTSHSQCTRIFPKYTQLLNGTIKLVENGVCKFRCLHPIADCHYRPSEWQQFAHQGQQLKAHCDIVEVACRYWLFFTHIYLQMQIYEIHKNAGTVMKNMANNEPIRNTGTQGGTLPPDVHLLIIDSVDLQSLPKTLAVLKNMKAIPFPHLNKVGLNSQPNAYALFFGIQTSPIEPNPMQPEGYEPPRGLLEMGNLSLNDEPFIGFTFKRKGYRTMMAEDAPNGVFNEWPVGKGFDAGQPTDHYMRPYQLRYYEGTMTNSLFPENCQGREHRYKRILEYLAQFVDAYRDEPKFSISWMTMLTHDELNNLQKMDDDLQQFLIDKEKKLSNAFLFVMSDHGLRYGKYRETLEGEMEDYNPALFLVLPQKLRSDGVLMNNLRKNARNLISHFDLHATLEHIAQHGFDLLSTSPALDLNTFGQSLFIPFNSTTKGPRNCGTLGIPMEFCQCQFQRRNVTVEQQPLGRRLASALVEKMNGDIVKGKAGARCERLALNLDVPVQIEHFVENQIYKITFETVPGNGLFQGFCQLLNQGEPTEKIAIISKRIVRLNKYGSLAAECARNAEIAPYCTCKNGK